MQLLKLENLVRNKIKYIQINILCSLFKSNLYFYDNSNKKFRMMSKDYVICRDATYVIPSIL